MSAGAGVLLHTGLSSLWRRGGGALWSGSLLINLCEQRLDSNTVVHLITRRDGISFIEWLSVGQSLSIPSLRSTEQEVSKRFDPDIIIWSNLNQILKSHPELQDSHIRSWVWWSFKVVMKSFPRLLGRRVIRHATVPYQDIIFVFFCILHIYISSAQLRFLFYHDLWT